MQGPPPRETSSRLPPRLRGVPPGTPPTTLSSRPIIPDPSPWFSTGAPPTTFSSSASSPVGYRPGSRPQHSRHDPLYPHPTPTSLVRGWRVTHRGRVTLKFTRTGDWGFKFLIWDFFTKENKACFYICFLSYVLLYTNLFSDVHMCTHVAHTRLLTYTRAHSYTLTYTDRYGHIRTHTDVRTLAHTRAHTRERSHTTASLDLLDHARVTCTCPLPSSRHNKDSKKH